MIKVLIIDDEKWTRNVIKSFVKWDELGIEIIGEAEDGEEGLALIKEKKPAIIITDMSMPNIDGVELLQILKQEGIEAKIIVVSGHDDYEYMKQAIRSKAFEYILKPIDPVELNKILKQCVQELCLEQKTDTFVIHERFDQKTLDLLIKRIKTLNLFIQEKDLTKIKSSLNEIALFLEDLNKDEKVITRLLDDYMIPLIRVEVIHLINSQEDIINHYRKLRKEVEKGLELNEYLDELYKLLERGIILHKQLVEKAQRPVTELAKDYIDRMYKQDISLKKIARHFYTSKEYLSRAFKNKYHITISQYILKLKMKEAVNLLDKGLNHSQIAEHLSYHDPTYFYKVFKKYYGCTPGDYKKKNKG